MAATTSMSVANPRQFCSDVLEKLTLPPTLSRSQDDAARAAVADALLAALHTDDVAACAGGACAPLSDAALRRMTRGCGDWPEAAVRAAAAAAARRAEGLATLAWAVVAGGGKFVGVWAGET